MAAVLRKMKLINHLTMLIGRNSAIYKNRGANNFSSFLAVQSPISPPSGFRQSLGKCPSTPSIQDTIVRQMKYLPLDSVKLRCQYCYYVLQNGFKAVYCTKFPRHRQHERTDRNTTRKLAW